MNNTTLLKRLEEIALVPALIYTLIKDIKQEIQLDAHSSSDKQRIKHCLSVCEKLAKGYRIILATSHFEEDTQYFTDAVFGVALKGNDIITELPKDTEDYQFKKATYIAGKHGEYPDMTNIFKVIPTKTFKINAKDLYGLIKTEETINIKLDEDIVSFNSDNLKNVLTFMNIKDEVFTLGLISTLKPLIFTKDNSESKGLLCPLRGNINEGVKVYELKDTRLA